MLGDLRYMNKSKLEITKEFLNIAVFPILLILFQFFILRPGYFRDGQYDYFLMWICIGFPFGIKKMYAFILPFGHDIGATLGILFLNVIVAGIIGGFVAMYAVIRAIFNLITYVYLIISTNIYV